MCGYFEPVLTNIESPSLKGVLLLKVIAIGITAGSTYKFLLSSSNRRVFPPPDPRTQSNTGFQRHPLLWAAYFLTCSAIDVMLVPRRGFIIVNPGLSIIQPKSSSVLKIFLSLEMSDCAGVKQPNTVFIQSSSFSLSTQYILEFKYEIRTIEVVYKTKPVFRMPEEVQ